MVGLGSASLWKVLDIHVELIMTSFLITLIKLVGREKFIDMELNDDDDDVKDDELEHDEIVT